MSIREQLEEHAGVIKAALALIAVVVFTWWWYADAPVRVGPSPGAEGRVLILLHGHGASKTDLEPLAKELAQSAPTVTFILPSGPHKMGLGRTWYPTFVADTKEALDARLLELRAQARAVVSDIIEDLRSDGVPPGHIYVGGFSQGASVALDVVLTEPVGAELGGLVSLSGGAIALDLAPLEQRAPTLRAFVSHGRADPVLGGSASRDLVAALEEGDREVTFVEFDGGHEIPPTVVHALGQFLNAP